MRSTARRWSFEVLPDKAPEIAFDGLPKRSVNGALEIAFTVKDDYGVQEAHAEIVPVETDPTATPLYPLPEYRLDIPRRNARDAKGVTSRNLTEHPLVKQARAHHARCQGCRRPDRPQPAV